MRSARAARQTDDQTARVLIPMRRAKSGKCRNEINSTVVRGGICQIFDFRRIFDNLQAVSEPPDHRAADKNAAFQRVFGFTSNLPSDCGEKFVFGFYRLCADVLQHKTTGAVSAFGQALFGAKLSEKRRLLVARDTRDFYSAEFVYRIYPVNF